MPNLHERRYAELDQWVLARLAGGPVPSRVIEMDGRKAGYSRTRLWKSRGRLFDRVEVIREASRDRFGAGRWVWRLRNQDQPAASAEVPSE